MFAHIKKLVGRAGVTKQFLNLAQPQSTTHNTAAHRPVARRAWDKAVAASLAPLCPHEEQ